MIHVFIVFQIQCSFEIALNIVRTIRDYVLIIQNTQTADPTKRQADI